MGHERRASQPRALADSLPRTQCRAVESARITVRLTPRAARDELQGVAPRGVRRSMPRASDSAANGAADGTDEPVLRVRVTAPPVAGRANRALTDLLADVLGVPKGDVRVVAGQSARDKVIAIDGVATAAVWERLRQWFGAVADD